MKNKFNIILLILCMYFAILPIKLYAAETWSSGSIAAKTYSSSNTITLNGNVTLSGKITINSGVTLTIKGAGKITRASTYEGIMFQINDGGALVITGSEGNNNDIVITGNGANVTATSPVIDCSEKLSLTNVTIKNNKGTKKGGCIVAQPKDVNINITNCVISGCTSKHGSALYLIGEGSGPVNVTRTIIEKCEILEDGWGGTIRTNGGGNWQLTLEDCVIRNNTSTWRRMYIMELKRRRCKT